MHREFKYENVGLLFNLDDNSLHKLCQIALLSAVVNL